MITPMRSTMSTSWRSAPLALVLVAVAFVTPIAADTTTPEADVPGEGSTVTFDHPILGGRALSEERAALRAHQSRLDVWESDLTRRAAGEGYFADLDGYVTPSELASSIVLSSLIGAALALGLLRLLDRYGHWRSGARRQRQELEQLERRVLTGLREFDELLNRLYDRADERSGTATSGLMKDRLGVATAGGVGTPDAPSPKPSPTVSTPPPPRAAEPGRAPAEHRRRLVLDLARQGVERDEIGRRAELGPAEVSFILRMAGAR